MNEPIPLPLFAPLSNRGGTVSALKDSRLYNGFAEKSQASDDVWVFKRPGLSQYSAIAGPGTPGMGVFNWKEDIYSVFGGTLYKNGVSKGSVDASSNYTFTSCLGATPKLFLKNRTRAYVYSDGGGLVAVTDVNYPTTTVPGCVYLDGFTYVFDTANRVVGDDFNDQLTWPPLNALLAQIEPDEPVALAKQLVYAIALKKISTEVFYDAGNSSGSPLGPVQGSKMNVGCRDAGSVCDVGGDLAWVGTTRMGSIRVMMMSNVKGERISTPPVERLLAPLDYTTTWAWSADVAGHSFYVVTLVNSNLTLVFDLTAATWYIWTDTNGNYLPIVSSTFDSLARPVLQHATDGKLYSLNPFVYQDDAVGIPNQVPIPFSLHTPNFDGGQRLYKSSSQIELLADRIPTSLGVAWSDDDFKTFTAGQPLPLDQDRPMLQDGSSFRRRSYLITHADNTPLRLWGLRMSAAAGTF